MSHSSKKPNNSMTGYTMEEFDSRLNAMLATYGISALVLGNDLPENVKQRTYEVKMIPPPPDRE